ncbi:MAG: thioredoxin family protein [Malacoplasma sp.]
MSNLKIANDKNFKELITNSLKSVVKFGATWCGPCKMILPILEELSDELSDVSFIEVDIDDVNSEKLVAEHNIQMVPTLFFYKGKTLVSQVSGFKPKDELKKIINAL